MGALISEPAERVLPRSGLACVCFAEVGRPRPAPQGARPFASLCAGRRPARQARLCGRLARPEIATRPFRPLARTASEDVAGLLRRVRRDVVPSASLGARRRRAWQSRAAMAFRFPHCEPAAGSSRERSLQPRAKRGGGRSAWRSRSWGKSSWRNVGSRIFRPILMTWLMARGQRHGSPVAHEPSLSAARDGMNFDLKAGQLCAFPARVREDRHLAPVGRRWFAVPSVVLADDWLQLSCSTTSSRLSAGAGA